MNFNISEPTQTDPFRTGWQTLEGKLTAGAVTVASGVLMKLTGIDFGLVFKNDPVETSKAVDKAVGGVTSMVESYKAIGQVPAEFFGAVKFGMALVFIGFIVTRYIDRRFRLKQYMIESANKPPQGDLK